MRLSRLNGDLRQLKQEGQALSGECDINKRQATALGEKIRRKLGEKKKLTMAVSELRNAREEEEPEEDTATYVSYLVDCYMYMCRIFGSYFTDYHS